MNKTNSVLKRLRLLSDQLYIHSGSSERVERLIKEIRQLYAFLASRLHRRTIRRAMGAAFALIGLGFSQSVEAQTFAPAVSSPFGLSLGGQVDIITIDLVDIDGDGDYDVLGVPYYSEILVFWENTGTPQSPDFSTTPTPLLGPQIGEYLIRLDFADLDDDGDYDMIAGEYYGFTKFYENTGTPTSPVFGSPQVNPFGIGQSFIASFPSAADMDGDGDIDLMVGELMGNVQYYQNTGSATSPSFAAPQMNPFGLDTAFYFNIPELVDLDADGDYDMLSTEYYGGIRYFENTGSSTNPQFAAGVVSPFGLQGMPNSYITLITSADLDNDGDMDLLVTDYGGGFRYYENTLFNIGQPESEMVEVQVYPNPASTYFSIDGNLAQITSIAVLDVTGKVVLRVENPGDKIDIQNLSNGIYTVQIMTERGDQFQKLQVN